MTEAPLLTAIQKPKIRTPRGKRGPVPDGVDGRGNSPSDGDVDPALVEAMAARAVRRKAQPYGNRKAGPGRPKGISKPPGSGKKAGTPNVLTPEFREWLNARAKPFEVLAAICCGESIQDGDTKRKPTVSERMRAAETLARKLLPDLAATAVTGSDGGPIAFTENNLSPLEIARRIAFALAQGVESAEARHPAPFLPPARKDPFCRVRGAAGPAHRHS